MSFNDFHNWPWSYSNFQVKSLSIDRNGDLGVPTSPMLPFVFSLSRSLALSLGYSCVCRLWHSEHVLRARTAASSFLLVPYEPIELYSNSLFLLLSLSLPLPYTFIHVYIYLVSLSSFWTNSSFLLPSFLYIRAIVLRRLCYAIDSPKALTYLSNLTTNLFISFFFFFSFFISFFISFILRSIVYFGYVNAMS